MANLTVVELVPMVILLVKAAIMLVVTAINRTEIEAQTY